MVGGRKGGDVGGSGVSELIGIDSVVVFGFVFNPPPTPPNLKSVVPKFLLSTGVDSLSLNTPTETNIHIQLCFCPLNFSRFFFVIRDKFNVPMLGSSI